MKKNIRLPLVLGLFCAALPQVICQETPKRSASFDYTSYYRYPLSVGFQYLPANYLEAPEDHEAYDLSAQIRYPLPIIPSLTATVMGGVTDYAPKSQVSRWSHREFFALIGAGWAKRLSKPIEVGAEILAGASLSLFENIIPDQKGTANRNALAQTSARVAFMPSYNVAIEASPSVKYSMPLDSIRQFSGLRAGLSLSAHFRLGDDPDTETSAVRSLRLMSGNLSPVFPAMQSWYTKNPISYITLHNSEKYALEDVEIAFLQKNYMDSPTVCASIPRIKAGETVEIPILAAFNESVFRNEGITPLSGEIIASFSARGREREQRISVGFDLQDRSALIWDDDRKAAAFITPVDGAIRNYSSFIRQTFKDRTIPGYSQNVQYACQLFHALSEIGILYQADPLQAYASIQGSALSVDSISLPRDTLKRITGDCDDLSVLCASMLETIGIETALITVPGHIYVAFNTKVPANLFQDIHPERSMTIPVNGDLWVPFEVTLIGKGSFLDAWQRGAEQWESQGDNPLNRQLYPVREAQETYRPVSLKETDLGLQYGNPAQFVTGATRDMQALVASILSRYEKEALSANTKEQINRLGIRQAKFGKLEAALKSFDRALALDRTYSSAIMNTANTHYLMKNYAKALAEYKKAEQTIPESEINAKKSLLTNMAKCYSALGEGQKATETFALAKKDSGTSGETTERALESALGEDLEFGEW